MNRSTNPYEIEGINRRVRLAVINDGLTEAQAAQKFNLKLSTVNTIMGNADGALNGAKAKPVLANGRPAEMKARDERIVEAARNGEPYDDIAERFGMGRYNVSRIARAGGVVRKERKFRTIPAHVRDGVANMVREGATDDEAAAAFGISTASVGKIRLQFGLDFNQGAHSMPSRKHQFDWTPELRGKALRMADDGVPNHEIAKALGVKAGGGAVSACVSRVRRGIDPHTASEVIHEETTAEIKRAVTGAQQVVEGSAAKPKGGFAARYERMTALKAAYDSAKLFIDLIDEDDEEGALAALEAISEIAKGV